MKKRASRVFFIILPLIISICLSACNAPPEQTAEPTANAGAGVTVRYGMIDGQWGQFGRYEYNQNGQLTSVTTISPFTLAPLLYETRKMDRVFIYSEGKISRVWINRGGIFEMTYSDDGLTATGVTVNGSEETVLELKFNQNNIIISEKYSPSAGDSYYQYLYDDQGRIISTINSSGQQFTTTHIYDGNNISIKLTDSSGAEIVTYSVTVDNAGNPLSLCADSETITYTYTDGKCTDSLYANKRAYKMEYLGDKLISTVTGEGENQEREEFTYEGDKVVKYKKISNDTYLDGCASQSESLIYTYSEDGIITKTLYVLTGYDADGNEVYTREEQM